MKPRIVRKSLLVAAALAVLCVPAVTPAHATSKDMIQLQTEVQQLLDMVQRLQSTVDTKFALMQQLAQQTADQAAQMTQTVNALQQKLNTEAEAQGGKTDAISGQVQSLNDSVDELKTRIAKLDQSIQNLQAQVQTLQQQSQPSPAAIPGAAPGTAPGAPSGALPGAAPGTSPGQGSAPGGDQSGQPAPGQQSTPGQSTPGQSTPGQFTPGQSTPGQTGPGQAGAMPGAAPAPPLQETYQGGLRDFNAGRDQLAASEFGDVIHYYPLDDLAGSAQFYLGEIAYQKKNYDEAINDYNAVIEGFGGNVKAPAAELHKGFALLALNKRAEGIRELRLVIQRHPQTPEAARARSRLNGMGVRITAER